MTCKTAENWLASNEREALSAELCVLHIVRDRDSSVERKRLLEASVPLAENLGAHVVTLAGSDTARMTATFVREKQVTHAIVGRSATHRLRSFLHRCALQEFMAEAPHVDLHIATQEVH